MGKIVPGAAIALAWAFGWSAWAQTGIAEDKWAVTPRGSIISRQSVLPDSTALVKSLGDAAELVLQWKPPADRAAWGRRRPEAERAFRAAIGLTTLPERSPLNARTVARHDFGDYVVENVIFESRPGFPVTANLYRPKAAAAGKRPAILCPIGHHLEAGKTATVIQARSIGLARMGFIVLTYDAIGQGERMFTGNVHHDAGYALMPLGETIAGWMVWDSMRAIDYLLTLEDVDPRRIGITGNSGGGLNTLFTAALDERIAAAVVVGYTYEFRHWIKYAGSHCTCTHLPGLFSGMEWFEIAGLIAPRPLLMLQGEYDSIFQVEGARRAARGTEAVYAAVGQPGCVRLDVVPGQPHAYTQPFRERMNGWMAQWLLGRGRGEPLEEAAIETLPEKDPRLLCDPQGAVMRNAPTVVDLARRRALEAVEALDRRDARAAAGWVARLTAPPDAHPHFLAPGVRQRADVPGGTLQKISFVSEEGQYIPGLLWLPRSKPSRTVILVDEEGKAAAAESGLVEPLLENGYAVLSVDLRGRGETLGRYSEVRNINFELVLSRVLSGKPLPGRRAFDLIRTLDYLARRNLPLEGLAVVARGDDVLPALLAAAADSRIRRVAAASYLHSFVSQMLAREPRTLGGTSRELPAAWNHPQRQGTIDVGEYKVDFGSVIPDALRHADVADIAALIAPRPVLFCQARDRRSADDRTRARLERALPQGAYRPEAVLDARLLLEWLRSGQ